jgi:uncharacterized membrane protein (DUF485 family)
MSTTERVGGVGTPPPVDPWAGAHTSVEFATLRQRFRSFVLPVTAFFMAWYFLYVLLAAFAPHYMAIKVAGNVNIGLIVGLLQFVSTFTITTAYVLFADKYLDPISGPIREQVEGAAR